MGLPIVENLSGLQESILAYLEAPNSIFAKNQKINRILLNLPIFPLFPLFVVPWAAVIIL